MSNVNPKDAQLVNEHLVQCLRDSVMVQNQTQIVHWGLLGSKFYQIHLLTGDIQTEMVEGIDDVAEHIEVLVWWFVVIQLIQGRQHQPFLDHAT